MPLRNVLTALAALALAALACLGLATPATAAYGPQTGSAAVSATTVDSGGTVTVRGGGFAPGATVTVTVSQGGDVYLTQRVTADENGQVSVTLTLTEVGSNTVTLRGRQADGTGSRVLGVKVGVEAANGLAADANAAGAALPHTGGISLSSLWAGIGLVAAGGLLVAVGRSRRRIQVAATARLR